MRCLVYPAEGYVSHNIVCHLERAGHHVVDWHKESHPSEAAWLAGLQQADAVFHVLHGHELHAKASVMRLLKSSTFAAPVTFVGISSPLTWAATPAPVAARTFEAPGCTAAPEQQSGAEGEVAEPVLSRAVFTERDVTSRRPAAVALQTYHLEQLILRCSRPGRLAAYVICPGVLYGAGEDDAQLHSLWRTAWEVKHPLTIYGTGSNRLPTLHVADLATYAEAVVVQQPASRYLLAADSEVVTQADLVTAVGNLLGNKQTQTLSGDNMLLQPPPSPLLLLDTPFSPSTLPQPAEVMHCCPNGLLANLPVVLQQFLHARGLTPLRILIRGPPASGKTHVAERLAQLYGVPHISIPTILAELPFMDAETQKACNAQLSSKEGRIAPQLMARLFQHLLAQLPAAANQGWVLEGWPKTLAAARLMTSSGADGGKPWDRAANRRVTGAPIKDKKKSQSGVMSATSGSNGKEGADASTAKSRRMTTAREDPSLTDCGMSVQNPDLLPNFVIELDVPEDELLRRVRALAAVETAAAAAAASVNSPVAGKGTSAAAAGKKPASAGKKDPGAAGTAGPAGLAVPPTTHNNEKDFARRMEVYRQIMQEDAADLTAKRSAVLSAMQSASQASNPSNPSPHETPGRSGSTTDRGGSSSRGPNMAVAAADLGLPPDVKLPEFGGYAAYFVEAGAKYLRISNACLDEAVPAAAALASTPRDQQQQQRQHVPLPSVEQQLVDLIGTPHNYLGLPTSEGLHQLGAAQAAPDACEAITDAAAAAVCSGSALPSHTPNPKFSVNLSKGVAGGGMGLPYRDHILDIAEALAVEQSQKQQQRLQTAARPLVSNLMGGVMPALMAGLVKVALSRPEDPCQVIADELLKAAERVEASYSDPLDDPAYAVQLAKVEAKAARDAARAAAVAAKTAREQAAVAAVAQQEAEAAAAAASLAASASAASMGAYGIPSPVVPVIDAAGTTVSNTSQPPTRPGSAVSGSKSVRSPIKTSVPPSAASSRSVKPAPSVKAR